jgi:hypothetical protein
MPGIEIQHGAVQRLEFVDFPAKPGHILVQSVKKDEKKQDGAGGKPRGQAVLSENVF